MIVISFGFMVLFFLHELKLSNAESAKYKEFWEESESDKSALQEEVWDVSCANIIMINTMCKRDQKKLKNNNDYLDVIDKIN